MYQKKIRTMIEIDEIKYLVNEVIWNCKDSLSVNKMAFMSNREDFFKMTK